MLFKILVGLAILGLGWRLWRQLKPAPSRSTRLQPGQPSVQDEAAARAILGVRRDAGPDEIRAAHRRLVASVHPDRGGSPELTRQVNGARDLLLKKRG